MTKQRHDYWQLFFGDIFQLVITGQLALSLLDWDDLWPWRITVLGTLFVVLVGLVLSSAWYRYRGSVHSQPIATTTHWLYLLNERDANPTRNWLTWSRGVLLGLVVLMAGVSLLNGVVALPPTAVLFLGLDSLVFIGGILAFNVLRWGLQRRQ
ncbi:MAG: hypothetical protein LKH74_11020 [Levilactobacillus sp.]|jgi:protein-S-isoprenylcysteine O-methyltransferase Ste14|uniref:hypothetical protein n=1 Tax=Levilactobacillus sp. TaxID=2767919 RepID=UPI002586E825|nr:hypothetical protein [Levilactobacillus sp.]MCI1554441.1 hypothetical protein [Levilactobacillus sp.]MCI1598228.1 hypothetical protein [Levilactobacillus sp.]MCI1605923.1 hypothetical protein [Levilactobacillus sp.]